MFGEFYPESAFNALVGAGAARRTSSSEGASIDIKRLEGNLLLALSSSAPSSGSNPTLDVTVEERADANDSWAPVPDHAWFNPATNVAGAAAKFAQVTDAASFQVRGLKRQYLKSQIRIKWTLGGTATPTYDFSVIVAGFDRYGDR